MTATSPRLRTAFLQIAPTPTLLQQFDALASEGTLDFHMFFTQVEVANSPWAESSQRPWATQLAGPGVSSLAVAREAVKRLAAYRPDVIVIAGYASLAAQMAMRLARAKGIPWVFFGERPGISRHGFVATALREVAMGPLRSAAGLAAAGKQALAAYRPRLRSSAKAANLPYVCALDPFLAIERPAPSKPGTVRFLFCGQLIERKGVRELFEAFSAVAAKHPGAHLHVVGEGPLRDLPLSPAVRDRVTFAGFLQPKELPRAFADADVFVLPSRHDGWALVVNQALAAGLPVIATSAVGAAVDHVEPNVSGLIVAPGDAAALAAAMATYVAHPARLATEGKAARLASKDLEPAVTNARWQAFLAEIAGRNLPTL